MPRNHADVPIHRDQDGRPFIAVDDLSLWLLDLAEGIDGPTADVLTQMAAGLAGVKIP